MSAGTRRVEPRFASHLVGWVRRRRRCPRPARRSSALAGVGHAVLARRGETARWAQQGSPFAKRRVPSPLECSTTRLRFRWRTEVSVLTRRSRCARLPWRAARMVCAGTVSRSTIMSVDRSSMASKKADHASSFSLWGDIARKRKVGLDWRATGVAHRARSARADTSRRNLDGGRTRACQRTARTCTLRGPRLGRRDAIARGQRQPDLHEVPPSRRQTVGVW